MTLYPPLRLGYENRKIAAGTPWFLEDETGERVYFGELRGPGFRTVRVPGGAREHGYLEFACPVRVSGTAAEVETDGTERSG